MSLSPSASRRPPPPRRPPPRPQSLPPQAASREASEAACGDTSSAAAPRRPPPPRAPPPRPHTLPPGHSVGSMPALPPRTSSQHASVTEDDDNVAAPAPVPDYAPVRGSAARQAWLAESPTDLKSLGLPSFLCTCLLYLAQPRALREEGLFRVPGNQSTINDLLAQVQDGAELDLSDILEPTVVTGLLKGYLTRTTNAVVPLPNHKPLATAVTHKDLKTKIAIVIFAALGAIRAAMADLPQSSRVQLRALIWVFVQVVETKGNQMTAMALATSVGPSVFAGMATSCAQRLVRTMLEYPCAVFAP